MPVLYENNFLKSSVEIVNNFSGSLFVLNCGKEKQNGYTPCLEALRMHNFALQLQSYKPHLSGQEQKLADYLMANQETASQLSILELSERTGVSTATISRFAKTLGYDNFQALRLALVPRHPAQDQSLFAELSPADDTVTLAKKIFNANNEALQATAANLSEATLDAAVGLIMRARYLGFYGLGASNIVALDGYHKFLRTAIPVVYAMDYHMQLMSITHLKKEDAAILVSHSGEDRNALALAAIAQKNQVPLIVITGAPGSRLAKQADVTLVAVAAESAYRPEALHALIAEMSLMDTLFMITALRTDSRTKSTFQKVRKVIDETRK
jgi:DNA-binding MurR/RpiR family transcriptional regulator